MAKETITVRVYTTSGGNPTNKEVSTLKELQDIVKEYVEVVGSKKTKKGDE